MAAAMTEDNLGTLAHLSHLGLDSHALEEGLELLERAVHSERALNVSAALGVERL